MKKLTFLILSLFTLSLGANAQLRVLSNGHVQVGDWTKTGRFSVAVDTTNTAAILGASDLFSGGTLSFGGRNDVTIKESSVNALSYNMGTQTPKMVLTGRGGIEYVSKPGTVFYFNPVKLPSHQTGGQAEESWEPFVFNISLKAPSYLTTSDARYKKNIESLESLGKGLMDLTPVKYNLAIPAKNGDETMDSETMAKDSKLSKDSEIYSRLSFGFLAQEVREIYPELVYEDEEGMLSLDYNGFIPLLVDEIKSLNAKLDQQQEIIANLTSASKKTKGTAGIENLYGDDNVVLMQNRPNPFKTTTEIKCHLPQEVSEAFICIYDLNGRQQMRLDLRERGDVAVTISGSSLQPGMYIYSLITDGREADSKRMILTE